MPPHNAWTGKWIDWMPMERPPDRSTPRRGERAKELGAPIGKEQNKETGTRYSPGQPPHSRCLANQQRELVFANSACPGHCFSPHEIAC